LSAFVAHLGLCDACLSLHRPDDAFDVGFYDAAFQQISGNIRTKTATRPGSVDSGRWYDVRLTVAGDSVKAWLDDMPVFDDVLRLK
jgi:hypothetical protein